MESMNLENEEDSASKRHFYIPKKYIANIISSGAESSLCSFIWKGEPGIGKSHVTLHTLEEMGLRNKKEYAVLSGYITPLELYTFLYHNRNKIVVLDDIPNIFDDDVSYHLLLSILWTVTGERMVYYLTSSSKLKVPSSFEFKGKVIFLTNRLPKESESLRSRCLLYEMNLPYWQKLEIMEDIAKTQEISQDVMAFIRGNTDETTKNFNLRTLVKINGLYLHNNGDWRTLAIEQLGTDETLVLVKRLCTAIEKTSEQVREFTEKTGLSRTTFFRLKEKLRNNSTARELYVRNAKFQR
jgi:hypothetical protein